MLSGSWHIRSSQQDSPQVLVRGPTFSFGEESINSAVARNAGGKRCRKWRSVLAVGGMAVSKLVVLLNSFYCLKNDLKTCGFAEQIQTVSRFCVSEILG